MCAGDGASRATPAIQPTRPVSGWASPRAVSGAPASDVPGGGRAARRRAPPRSAGTSRTRVSHVRPARAPVPGGTAVRGRIPVQRASHLQRVSDPGTARLTGPPSAGPSSRWRPGSSRVRRPPPAGAAQPAASPYHSRRSSPEAGRTAPGTTSRTPRPGLVDAAQRTVATRHRTADLKPRPGRGPRARHRQPASGGGRAAPTRKRNLKSGESSKPPSHRTCVRRSESCPGFTVPPSQASESSSAQAAGCPPAGPADSVGTWSLNRPGPVAARPGGAAAARAAPGPTKQAMLRPGSSSTCT